MVPMAQGDGVDAMAERDVARVRRIVLDGLRGVRARVYLFGSRATGTARRTSDIDVAVMPQVPLPRGVLSAIREALDESDVLLPVDLVDLTGADERLVRRVLDEGVPWS